jgi:hypothetical protein
VARGFAVHEAQEREYALLELQQATEHALDPAWEWMPTGGVGNLGWWKHVGGGNGRTGGGGDGDGAQYDGSGGGPQSRVSSVGSGGGPQSRVSSAAAVRPGAQ